MAYNNVVAVAIQRKSEIIERMSKGEPLTSIAQDLGYSSHQGIEERLGDDPDYRVALRAGVIAKVERREKELEGADNNVAVTRADRLLGHARWWAERLDPDRFGGKQTITVNQGVSMEQALDLAANALLDRMRVVEGSSEVIHSRNESDSPESA